MSLDKRFDAHAYLAMMAPLAGIAVQPEWEASVEHHLQVAAGMAERLQSVPVDANTLNLACRFVPGVPPCKGSATVVSEPAS